MSARTCSSKSTAARTLITGILLLLSTIVLTGCITLVDTEGSQEQRSDTIVTLTEGSELRQTFASRRQGLKDIELWLRPPEDKTQTPGLVRVELRQHPDDGEPIAEALFTSTQIATGGDTFYLSFPPLDNSQNRSYEIRVHSSGGDVQVLGRNEDVYGSGTAAQDGRFLLADAAFRLSYDYDLRAVLQDVGRLLWDSWLILPLAVVLLLPGWLLLEWSGVNIHLDSGSKIGAALGLSIATIPVLMASTSLAGLEWSRWSVLAAAIVLAAAAAIQLTRRLRPAPHPQKQTGISAQSTTANTIHSWMKHGPSIPLSLIAIFLITLVVRTAMVRDLSAPPWVDSVHHALITRLVMEQGAFPASLAPYLQVDAASYHPGFHSLLASFLWLTDLGIEQGMLWFGQLLNALNIFSVYLLTATLLSGRRGSHLAGLLAALVAGLFTPMPAYYTSWGRYTQLAALTILPAGLALVLHSIQGEANQPNLPAFRLAARRWRMILVSAVTLAGLYLTHYRVAAFFGCLLLSYGLIQAIRWVIQRGYTGADWKNRAGQTALLLAATGLLSLLLAAPWLVPSLKDLLLPRLSAWIPAEAQPFNGVTWPYLNTAWGTPAMLLAGLGLALGILQRRTFPWVLLGWVGLLFFIANLGMFGLPGSGFVNSNSVNISLYMPLAVSAGYLLSQVVLAVNRLIPDAGKGAFRWSLAGVGLVVAVFAARQQIPLLNPVTFLFRPADQQGIAWVAENIPEDETVLVNPFAWGYGQYAGNDGGYWISALGMRPTFPPPVLYGLSNSLQYIESINTDSQQIIDSAGDPPALHALLGERGIRYVYIGGRGGVLSPDLLRSSPLFAPRYARDGVFVFEVLE